MNIFSGLEVEVLSGREEACLIYQGVLQALPVYNQTVLVVDIGGGSTEFVLGKAGKPIYATSLKLGHIRLSEQFLNLGQKKEELKKEQVSKSDSVDLVSETWYISPKSQLIALIEY